MSEQKTVKMIEIGGGDTQTYVLPLENIDLTYLSKYVRSSRGSVPLWSKKQLDGEVQYFEIKIPTQEYDEDDCYYEPSDTYKCHICNTDVPTMFFKEHNESLKHKKNKNIFEKVLERVSKHINMNKDSNDKDNNQDVYYCVACSKTVKRKNKFKHEATEYHTNSLKNIQILNDFHNMFTEINNNDDRNAIEDEIIEKEYICDTPPLIVPNNLDSDIESNNFDNFNDSLLSAYKDFNNITIKPDLNSSEKDEVCFETYLRNVKSKYNIRIDLPKVEGKYVYIMNPKGVKVKITQAHYQGYQYIANKTYCILCSQWMEDITAHNELVSHVRNMLKPVNEDFARTINPMVSNCLVCNELTLNSDLHWNSEKHTKALEDTKVIQTLQYNDVAKAKKTLCDVCNVHIDTHNFLGHTNSKKHRNLQEIRIIKQNNMTKVNANDYLCGVCKSVIHRNGLNEHMNCSARPAANVNDSNSNYCHVCNVKIPGGGMKIHVKGKPHIKKLAENQKKNNNVQNGNSHQISPPVANSYSTASTSTNSVYTTASNSPELDEKTIFYNKLLKNYNECGTIKVKCIVCNVQVPNNRSNINEHMEGFLHNKEIEGYKKLVEVENNDKTRLRCKICDVLIHNVMTNFIEHLTGTLHDSEQFELLKFHTIHKETNYYICECCDERFINFMDHINSDSHTRTFQMEYEIDKSMLRKYVYEIDSHHGVARIFRELYKNLLRSNDIIKMSDGSFICQFCNIRLGRISEIDHVLGERHRLCVESAEASDESDD